MEHRHVQNISALIHFMDGLSDPSFNMGQFVHSDSKGCRTPACALGWACTMPTLQAEGLDITKLYYENHVSGVPSAMAEKVFGTYSGLFSMFLMSEISTPQQWARHARAYLKEHGHDVAPKTAKQADDFKSFMARVLKPIEAAKQD